MFLARTVKDIIDHKTPDTEVIVGLDGQWADPAIEDHPDVTVFYSSVTLGQRAMTNQLCRLSQAKYIMKVDAHCAFDDKFDKKLMDDMQDDWTMVPVMRNLHAFNWVCPEGHVRYQGPSGVCQACGKETVRDVVWISKTSPQSTSYCFDPEPHFQYFHEYKKRQKGNLVESMSLQGSCFMLTRDKYWELNISDEYFGSWGSQGIEVACKTWLSGGRVIVNKNTWYAHMFRTQGGDFSFPYENPHSRAVEAKKKAADMFFNGKWKQAKYPVSWLVQKFWPVFGWTDEDLKKLKEKENKNGPSKGIIYFTDNKLKLKIARKVQDQLKRINLPIVSSSLKPMTFGKNVHLPLERGYLTMFKQILAALEGSESEVIFFCEHDVLYHPSHFLFTPTDKNKFYYNQNFWKVWPDGFAAHWDANQVSGLCGYREHLIKFYTDRIAEVEKDGFNRSYEPGGRDPKAYEVWNSPLPNVDIRHDNNLTRSHKTPDEFRDKSTCINWQESTADAIPGWSKEEIRDIISP